MPDRMSNAQAVLLARAIKAGWPHQKFDDATVDVWAQGLRHAEPVLGYGDCEAAIYRLVTSANFSGPEAIKAEVRRIRDDRLKASGFDQITPNVNPNDVHRYRVELAALRVAIGDGGFDADTYRSSGRALTCSRPVLAIEGPGGDRPDVSRVFHRPERPSAADYGTAPVQIRRTVDPAASEAMEAERCRQMAALEAMRSTS